MTEANDATKPGLIHHVGASHFSAKRLFPIVTFLTFYMSVGAQSSRFPMFPLPPPGRSSQSVKSATRSSATTGDQKLLFILADFPDQPGRFTGSAWQNLFFSMQNISLTTYYREVSYGKLRYTGDIVGIQGTQPVKNSPNIAYIRLDYPVTYYADGQYGNGDFPKNSVGVVYHALQKLDNAGFDFSQYATNGKLTNNLFLIYGGSDHAQTDDDNCLHSISWQISSSQGSAFVSKQGITIDDFTIAPDQAGSWSGQMETIGTAVHEQGHAIGMPDLYDYSYKSAGAGSYDLMSYGTFGADNGYRPFHFGAYSKEFYGWVQPTIAPLGTTKYSLAPVETNPQIIKLYPKGNTLSKEYFLIENRQPIGYDQDWLKADLCAGIHIWHVDRSITDNYFGVNSPPSNYGGPHFGVVVVEADGRYDMIKQLNYGECSDSWTVGRVWNDVSIPNSKTWDNKASGLSVTIASQSGNVIDIIVTVSDPSNPCAIKPIAPPLATPANGFRTVSRTLTLSWTKAVCSSAVYHIWIFKGSSSGPVVDKAFDLKSPSYKTKLLSSGSTYLWVVRACTTAGCTDSLWRNFRIG